ncbi:metallophosphatase family protein [Candidatus Woesearchaeota archaeon]|nr:metallophosphatase family protein [Candidatus Woesearchaeota archaeon]
MPAWEEGRVRKMKVLLDSKLEVKNIGNVKKIVVLSDTHIPVRAAKIPEQIIREMKNADLIVHAGDFQTIEVVDNLEKSGKFIGVCGNMDSDDVAEKLPEKIILNIKNNGKEFKIGVTHGSGPPQGLAERILTFFEEKLDCIIFGHSHHPFNEIIGNTLLFNPGSSTDTVFTNINTFGVIKISDRISGEIINIKK